MNENRYIIILNSDGGVRMHALEQSNEPTLKQLQNIVGGYIEAVAATHGVLIVNEEAKLLDLPYNTNATVLMKNKSVDYICGDAVLCKPKGDELTGFLRHYAEWIVNSLGTE